MIRDIPIFESERKDGLEHKIRSEASIAYGCEIQVATPEKMNKALIDAAVAKLMRAEATNENQFDLFYLKTILATIGWNKNDDVFDKVETFMARATPEDKPFNLEHNPNKVIGHITGSYVIDEDGKLIANDATIDSLPSKFHIVTDAVLYKFKKSKDENLEKEMAVILSEIAEGKWYVSMEALFAGFDYAVVSPNGTATIIPRNEDSAFLTKHLRAYGGAGEYESHKLGRVMRNITFSGKGLVKKPANPESVILSSAAAFSGVITPITKEFNQFSTQAGYKPVSDNTSQNSNKESNRMADTNEVLAAQLKSVETTLAAAVKKNEELEKRLAETNEKQVQAKISDLEGQVKAKDEKITSLQAAVKTEQDARVSAEANLKTTSEKVSTLEAEVNKSKVEQTKAARISQWVDRTGVEQAVAMKQVEKLAKLDDAEFKDFLETQPAKAAATPEKKDDKKDEKTIASGSKNADTKVLENAKADEKPNVSGDDGVNKSVEQTRASLGNFLGTNFLRKSGKKGKAADTATE